MQTQISRDWLPFIITAKLFFCCLCWYSSECVTRVKTHNRIENIRHCMQKIEILIFFRIYEYIFHIVQQFHLHRVRSEARKEQKNYNGEWVSSFSLSPEIMRSKIIFHAKKVEVSCHSSALSEYLLRHYRELSLKSKSCHHVLPSPSRCCW